MHKQEIIDAYFEGAYGGDNISGEQYYQKTFVSKVSDAKDVVLGYKTSLDAQMLDSQLPQQETLFTEEQVREAIGMARKQYMVFEEVEFEYMDEEIIQSIKQPKKD
jgi:hypothetical protein